MEHKELNSKNDPILFMLITIAQLLEEVKKEIGITNERLNKLTNLEKLVNKFNNLENLDTSVNSRIRRWLNNDKK